MTHADYGYGLWGLALVNAAVFILFAFSFLKPATKRDWRSLGAFSAFIIALFAEMYGFPLTIFVLSGWLQSYFPAVDWWSHDAGHLLEMMFGWRVNPHYGPFHIASFVLIGVGYWLISVAWTALHLSQRKHQLALTGIYARIRHPQYVGFILVMLGFLLQWPTLLTLAMFPVLVVMYIRLARHEEKEALANFGEVYRDYMARVPGFIPNLTIHSRRRRPWRSLTGMADVIAGKVNADVLTGLIIRTSLPDLTAHYCSNPGSTAQSSWEGKFALHGQIRCGADARH